MQMPEVERVIAKAFEKVPVGVHGKSKHQS